MSTTFTKTSTATIAMHTNGVPASTQKTSTYCYTIEIIIFHSHPNKDSKRKCHRADRY